RMLYAMCGAVGALAIAVVVAVIVLAGNRGASAASVPATGPSHDPTGARVDASGLDGGALAATPPTTQGTSTALATREGATREATTHDATPTAAARDAATHTTGPTTTHAATHAVAT